MHPPQVDGKRQHGTIPAPRRSTLTIIPGYLHLLARRRGQRPWVVTHPGRLCRATTTGRKSPCASCAMRCSDRQDHHNDHDNQPDTHPDTSWRAKLLTRGVGSAWGGNPKVVVLPEPGASWINLLSQRYQGPEQRSRTLLKLP